MGNNSIIFSKKESFFFSFHLFFFCSFYSYRIHTSILFHVSSHEMLHYTMEHSFHLFFSPLLFIVLEHIHKKSRDSNLLSIARSKKKKIYVVCNELAVGKNIPMMKYIFHEKKKIKKIALNRSPMLFISSDKSCCCCCCITCFFKWESLAANKQEEEIRIKKKKTIEMREDVYHGECLISLRAAQH